jgi:hypothetical protein
MRIERLKAVGLKISAALTVCFFVLLTAFMYPAAMAASQTTEIYQVTGPSSIVAGSQSPIPVTATVYYNNTVSGYQLVVGILDAGLSPQAPVPGVVISSTDPCVNQPGVAAICVVMVPKQSGVEQVSFQIGGIFGGKSASGKWNLNVTSALFDLKNNLVPGSLSSKLIQIELVPVALTVTVPSSVTVTVDGVQQPVGSVSVGVALGQHNVTVPMFVQVNETARLRFSRWSDGYPGAFRTLVVTNTTSLQAVYVTQYLLTLVGSQPNSTVTVWYDANTNATFSANQYRPVVGPLSSIGATVSFQGWYENGQLITTSTTGTILMDQPHTLTAVWQVSYFIPATVTVVIIALVLAVFLILHRGKASPPKRRRRRRRQ